MATDLSPVGFLKPDHQEPAFEPAAFKRALLEIRRPLHVVREGPGGRLGLALDEQLSPEARTNGARHHTLMATLPALYPEWLGDRSFTERHGVRFPYVAGAMANGIHTARMVIEMGKAGMLGFFGAAGLMPEAVERAIDEIQFGVGQGAWGCNLIHSPAEPALEEAIVDLYIRRGVTKVSASAYMSLTPAVVRYAVTGLRSGSRGRVLRRHHLFAKVSRPEVAAHFMSPAPQAMLDELLQRGQLTAPECELARRIPLAEDLTVESDSGGHTDNRPLGALFPSIAGLRDELIERHGFLDPIRLGAAGGLGTPSAVAAAFSLGAAYVLTGSINQAAVESGLSAEGKRLLCEADLADVIMAPAADMFEMGVKLQVLRRGTMFGVRSAKLYDHYLNHDSLDAMPEEVRKRLEREVLGETCEKAWAETCAFFQERAPQELEKANRDPKHQMALVFRWYLGKSSQWAMSGEPNRRADYQIWCGPAMGAFNRWVKGSYLESPEQRTVVQIALNLMEGAAILTRVHQLRTYGVATGGGLFQYNPRPLSA